MKPDEDITPAQIQGMRRALAPLLAVLPAPERAMVGRMARMVALALEARATRRPRLAPLAVEPVSPEADDAPADDLTRAAARRILATHGRRDGAA